MVDRQIDSGENKKDFPYYPNAETYEAENSSLELQIKVLKAQIADDLKDELARIEYLLNQRERKLALRELEVRRREEAVALREQRISQLEVFEATRSPKELPNYKGSLEEPYDYQDEVSRQETGVGHNIDGKGGLIGSKNSNSTIISKNTYQGDSIKLDDGSNLIWDSGKSEYQLVSKNQGLKFTYFAVEAAYLLEGFINFNYPQFYSQTILHKQVWYEQTPRDKYEDGLGPQYQGRVPLEILRNKLNEQVNTARMAPNGSYLENQDFSIAYKHWRYKYQTGTFFKNASGELYAFVDSTETDSRGNAPNFRTDGNFKSPTYGQKKPVSADEKIRWGTKLGGKPTKGKGKK